ncbi:hypothetical protein J6590_042642 [Homalodisca vitripennis]|nr:hypothetical protein J6590_042642 [Homalodisca vitripennis]
MSHRHSFWEVYDSQHVVCEASSPLNDDIEPVRWHGRQPRKPVNRRTAAVRRRPAITRYPSRHHQRNRQNSPTRSLQNPSVKPGAHSSRHVIALRICPNLTNNCLDFLRLAFLKATTPFLTVLSRPLPTSLGKFWGNYQRLLSCSKISPTFPCPLSMPRQCPEMNWTSFQNYLADNPVHLLEIAFADNLDNCVSSLEASLQAPVIRSTDYLHSFKKKCDCAVSSGGGGGKDPGYLQTGRPFNSSLIKFNGFYRTIIQSDGRTSCSSSTLWTILNPSVFDAHPAV